MISDPYFYVVAVLSVFFHGMGKAGFGLGLPILAIPLMSLFIPPLQALAILVIPLIFMDLVTIRRFWSLWDINLVKSIIPLTLVGVIIGTITYSFLSDKYGDWILFNTPLKKNSYFLWFMPYILFILGGVVLYLVIKKKAQKIK